MEGAQNYECSVTILDTIEEFMHCFHDELVASSEMPANSSNESEGTNIHKITVKTVRKTQEEICCF